MKLFSTVVHALDSYGRMLKDLKTGNTPSLCVGLSAVHKANFIAAAAEDLEEPVVVLCQDDTAAARLARDLNAMTGGECAAVYPSRDFSYRQMEAASSEYEQTRIGILSRVLSGDIKIILASVQAAMSRTIPPDRLRESTFILSSETSVTLDDAVSRLAQSGYIRRSQVDGPGQYAVRGGILDVYPARESAPVRIEYWGDEVDSISSFDLDTQRRTDSLEKVYISPSREVAVSPETLLEKLKAFLSRSGVKHSPACEILQRDLDALENGMEPDSYDKYFPLVYDEFCCLLDYFENAPVFFSEYADSKETEKSVFWQYSEDLKILFEEGHLCRGLDRYMLSPEEFEAKLESHRVMMMETFARSSPGRLKDLITLNPLQNSGWNGELKLLCADLESLLESGYCCVVMAGTPKAAESLAGDLKHNGLPAQYTGDLKALHYRKVYVLSGTLSSGFEYPEIKFSLTTTARSYSLPVRKPKKRRGEEIRSLTDLSPGDYIVHVSYGIGIYNGIHQLDIEGVTKDFLKISYAGSDVLYVPVTQLDMVSKYIGSKDDGRVRINRLHSDEWQKTRQRVKKAVDEMADELIDLYARRMSVKGYAFSEDTEFQRDFEAHFEYQETDDQLRCVQEIKDDMEKPVPMDRLLCGDVGFGKTEVALRAAFKCVTEGKQCAILCPTTILAWQHYQNIRQRMGNFPVRVELLSRFRTAKEQKQVIKNLEKGLVDIVVGTHRVVSKDVHFKDLGLAIIDEEQRFGVAYKERFKEMLTSVDMLTLSATPIPRTLNMAMSGIRDMSVIEEAPQNRHPIQTYVLEHDEGVIAEALKKELRRGGQAYYIHNNISTIYQTAARLQQMIPEARIAVGHGQMAEDELSLVWKQLMEQEIDILVCTTIIETGVDVSNCNTLIIENADKMGLSQLYQLRGRVGRSSRRAYAYFTFQRGKILSEIAAKRLAAIREFTRFGSGFQIAMRDLEIRGAGNILGTRQHGHMEAVGYDMYLRLLSEAVAKKQGVEPTIKPMAECSIDIQLEAHIPEKYIENLSQRIDIYRKIASIQSKEDGMDVLDELIDRFGEPPKSVKGLVDIALLRNLAAEFGFVQIMQRADTLRMTPKKLDPQLIAMLNIVFKGRCSALASEPPCIIVRMGGKDPLDCLREILQVLQNFREGKFPDMVQQQIDAERRQKKK